MAVMIYHNPRCSKSRQTLQLLEDKGIEPLVVEYLKTPLGRFEIKNLLKMLGMSAQEFVRKGEAEYKEQGLGDGDKTDDQIIAVIAKFPILLERPIVVNGTKAAIGRPPENVLNIL